MGLLTDLLGDGGAGSATSGAFGFPYTFNPSMRVTQSGVALANRGYFYRVQGAGTITKIGLEVGTSSGNICVGVYANSGSGRTSLPGTRKGTSGSVPCPVAGYAEIALGASVEVDEGDWLAIAADNTTASFWGLNNPGISGGALMAGTMAKHDAFPLADPAAANTENGPPLILVGVA